MMLAGLSSFTIIALERGNIDIIIFVLIVCASLLWLGLLPERLGAYTLILIAALLKFYPIVALVLIARESLRTLILITAVTLLVIAGFFWHFHEELVKTLSNVPQGSYFSGGLFGAVNLPYGAMLLINHALSVSAVHLGPFGDIVAQITSPDGWIARLLRILLVLGSFYLSLAVAGRVGMMSLIRDLPQRDAAFLMVGSALVAGCFFAEQNVNYRGIFLLFVIPGLLTMSSQRRSLMPSCLLIVVLMWAPALSHLVTLLTHEEDAHGPAYLVFWFVHECGWWWSVVVLDAALMCLLAQWSIIRKLVPARVFSLLEATP